MPTFDELAAGRLEATRDRIYRAAYDVVATLNIEAWVTPEPTPFSKRRTGRRVQPALGEAWGQLFDCAWFHFTGRVPVVAKGRETVLLLDINGELCVVDARGVPALGLTNVASEFCRPLGEPGKRVYPLIRRARGGERIDVWAEAGCNDLFGNVRDDGRIREAHVAVLKAPTLALYYDFVVLLDLMRALPRESARRDEIQQALLAVQRELDLERAASVAGARRILEGPLARRGGDASLAFTAIGHSHLDLGWLWPIRETKRKGARTLATVVHNMSRYPDYRFGVSQPQLWQWIKEDYPALYRKVKRLVRAGRIEPQGAMWVEADTNVTGGESLVRQLLYGKRFYRDEFGVDVRHLWLPDVFGYSAALPQLLKQAGVDYFMTQKLSWSRTNSFPHHSFHWRGIDGTSVLAHMLPEDNYNSPALPRSLVFAEKNYKDRGRSRHALVLFGIGDGGGGPGEEHLEHLARMKNLAGVGPVTQRSAAEFFEDWAQDADAFPAWTGELYLERHQGTFTTHGHIKRFNRLAERKLRETELGAALAAVLLGRTCPAKLLEAIWKEVLLYQFHDILPGSSIKRVYDECAPRYAAMLEALERESAAALGALAHAMAPAGGDAVFNPLAWPRTEWVRLRDGWTRVSVPAMGFAGIAAAGAEDKGESLAPPADMRLKATPRMLENELLRVTFAADGTIVSIFDKSARRDVLRPGGRANVLNVYRDDGDAWDFAEDYRQSSPEPLRVTDAVALLDGPEAAVTRTYAYGHSTLTQRVVLTAGSRRLDFRTTADWREPHAMLRTSFPIAVNADAAACGIQFGYVCRPTHENTSWDLAKDEVPAQKWVDVSQRDYGVALFDDGKYGHRVKNSTLDLHLLRSVPYPGTVVFDDASREPGEPNHRFTDQCSHAFAYALYPHTGDLVEGGVVRAAYEFDMPLIPVAAPARRAKADSVRFAPTEGDGLLAVDSPHVIVETVKPAEHGDALVVRMYEAANTSAKATLTTGFPIAAAEQVDLLEQNPQPLEVRGGRSVALTFRPFEIKTVRVGV